LAMVASGFSLPAVPGLDLGILSKYIPVPLPTYVLKGQPPLVKSGDIYNSDKLSMVALAYKAETKRMLPSVFQSPLSGSYAYAQAVVFNPLSHDLYTQNWQARLSPTILVAKQAKPISKELSKRAPEVGRPNQ